MVGMETRNVERLDRLRETRVPGVLYPRLFGVAWSEIDTALQRMHCNCEPVHAAGVFCISHGTSLGAKLLLLFLRLPPANAAAQVELIVRPVGESEIWLRLFDGKPVVTVQRESVSGLLAERFGPLEVEFCGSHDTLSAGQDDSASCTALFPGDSASTMGVSACCSMGDGRSERNRNSRSCGGIRPACGLVVFL